MTLQYGPGRREAVLSRAEVEVHQDQVHGGFPHRLDDLGSRPELPENLQIGFVLESALKTQPENRMVVHDTEADRLASSDWRNP